MPTIDDLHGAFALLEDQAPQASSDISTLTRPSHRGPGRGRTWAMAATVAAVITVGVAVPALLSNNGPSKSHVAAAAGFAAPLTPSTDSSAVLQFGFTIDDQQLRDEGFKAIKTTLNRLAQTIEYMKPSDGSPHLVGGEVALYYAGKYDPAQALRGVPVDVNGRPGYYFVADRTGPETVLAWEYAPGAWAEATGGSGTRDQVKAVELRLAKSARAQAATPVVPVSVHGLPTSTITSLLHYGDDAASGDFALGNAPGDAERWDVAWQPTAKASLGTPSSSSPWTGATGPSTPTTTAGC
jgi:hypothetical protein